MKSILYLKCQKEIYCSSIKHWFINGLSSNSLRVSQSACACVCTFVSATNVYCQGVFERGLDFASMQRKIDKPELRIYLKKF